MNHIYIVAAFALMIGSIVYIVKGNIQEWMLWAVTEAENYLGSGTGKLKLRYVYDKCVEKFPVVKYVLPFSIFSDWVDVVLDTMRDEIEKNPHIAAFAEKGE